MMTKDRETGLKMTRIAGGSGSGAAGANAPSGGTGTNRSSTTAGSGAASSSTGAGASAGKSKGKGNGNGNGNGGGTSRGAGTEIRLRPIATTTATASESAASPPAASGQQTNNKKSQKSQASTGGSAARNNTTTGTSSSSTAAAATTAAPTSTDDHASRNGHQEDMEAVVVGNNGVPPRPQKPCCLCWCCCCSCSCLALRGNQGDKEKHKDQESDLNCDSESMPSLEEIRSWGDSFEKLMRNSGGRKVFREFLKCEYSEENILFWLACEDLKKESKPELVEEKARLIYEDYISILSPKEVSLDSRVREVVNQNMMDPSPHTFDEAQVQIFTLMHRDSYPRFVNSVMYKKLAQLNTQHRGSSVSSAVSNPASRKESLAT